jgi:putative Flp pilus-assembly TadE/G-like protein
MQKLLRRRVTPDDLGQMPIALVVLTFLGLLVAIFWVGLPIGQATDQKAGSQSAADAAALAAAKQIADDLPEWIAGAASDVVDGDLPGLFDGLQGGFGLTAAEKFAELNDARIVSYTYDHVNDRIDVTVESKQTSTESTNQHSYSTASAELGLKLGNCEQIDDEPADKDDQDEPADKDDQDEPADKDEQDEPADNGEQDEPAVEEKPDVGTELRCGGVVLHFTVGGKDGGVRLDTDPDDLKDQVDIRLTS